MSRSDQVLDVAKVHSERIKKNAAKKDELRLLYQNFDTVFGSPEGKIILKWIMDKCGAARSPIVSSPNGKIQMETTLHNIAYQDFYRMLRSMISPRILKEVELFHKRKL